MHLVHGNPNLTSFVTDMLKYYVPVATKEKAKGKEKNKAQKQQKGAAQQHFGCWLWITSIKTFKLSYNQELEHQTVLFFLFQTTNKLPHSFISIAYLNSESEEKNKSHLVTYI